MNDTALQQVRDKLEKVADSGNLPLVTSAIETVHGEGNPNAEIVFIGEAAGRNEAIQRRPFVGVAGRLVNKQLEENGLKREDVYITNVVKTRPPNNRDPLPAEILAYQEYLNEELEIIKPKLVVTLGRFSMARFMPEVKISEVHGRVFKYRENNRTFVVMPFYHPAAALRRGTLMQAFIKDFQLIPLVLPLARKIDQNEEIEGNIQELNISSKK